MSGADERDDDRCPECGHRRHRHLAPSLPSMHLPRWVFLCLGIIVGAFGALVSSSIGAERKQADTVATSAAPPTSVGETGPTQARPATVVSNSSSTTTSTTLPTTTITTTTVAITTTVATTVAEPPTTPPGANVALTVATTTTTTLAPTTATAAAAAPTTPAP